jgi:hypothetical protein
MSNMASVRSGNTQRPTEPPSLKGSISTSPEALQELADGQLVIIIARWVLVAAGLLLAIWSPGDINDLRLQIAVLLLAAVSNFFLHAHVLRHQETLPSVVYLSSAADLTIISLLVASQGGFDSRLFVFYFPAIAALALTFPREVTTFIAGCGVGMYVLICLRTMPEPTVSDYYQALVVRVVMLAGVAFCGALYQQIEMNRRRAAGELPANVDPEEYGEDDEGVFEAELDVATVARR